MFTGIVEEIGTVLKVSKRNDEYEIVFKADKVLHNLHIGDSIAVNGVCLTITSYSSSQFSVDVMPETLKATSLESIKKDVNVNLERAMSSGGRFGGHFVSGHIDGVGWIKDKKPYRNAIYYEIQTQSDLTETMIKKGSVAVDGVSLTLFGVSKDTFTLALIPHTMEATILSKKTIGDVVNIECDMIGKYVHHSITKISERHHALTINKQFLKENGFA